MKHNFKKNHLYPGKQRQKGTARGSRKRCELPQDCRGMETLIIPNTIQYKTVKWDETWLCENIYVQKGYGLKQ